MFFDRILLLFSLAPCILATQPNAPAALPAPLRELPWGQLNFLHTTDTHGWHGGHLQEPQYSADWGDYISFAHHLHTRADNDGSDLLLIDTGDRVEGNGLYDASEPKGKYTFDILREQRIDVITPGNHELYQQNTSNSEYNVTVPDFKNSYIASNLDIYNPETGKLEALAPRFRKFKTKNQGIRIIALGFIFDFHGNANNTVVQPVEETIQEEWFQDAIRDREVDLFVVAGHVPVRDSQEYDAIYKAIRNVQWDTPIHFFGGHTHIRDYYKWDKKAYGLESGRYMETIGFASVSGLSTSGKAVAQATPKYERLYLDNNLYSLHHHTGLNSSTFDTSLGKNVSEAISHARGKMNLDKTFGCAPQDYWLNRAPYPANDSLLTWLETQVLPWIGNATSDSKSPPEVIITNSGAMRFDIFQGPFTIDTTFLVSPFTSGFRKIQGVPYSAARQVLTLLNNEGKVSLTELMVLGGEHLDLDHFSVHALRQLASPLPPVSAMTRQGSAFQQIGPEAYSKMQHFLGGGSFDSSKEKLIPGYTTTDDAGSKGDDTIHDRITFYDVPNCIATNVGIDIGAPPDTVDLVYNGFIEPWILLALRFLGVSYELEDTMDTMNGKTFTTIISEWVAENWMCE